MLGFIGLILFIGYFGYNMLQVNAASRGFRSEPETLLFFCASAIDLYAWIKSKF
jgi:hypothetical protein